MAQTRMANTVPAMGSLSDWGRVVWDRRDWVPNIAGTPMPRVSARPTTMRVMGWWRMACRVRGIGFSLNVGDFLIICRGERGAHIFSFFVFVREIGCSGGYFLGLGRKTDLGGLFGEGGCEEPV